MWRESGDRFVAVASVVCESNVESRHTRGVNASRSS
jgi:hypothetical protein